jgi:hypothetical protein
MGYYQDVDEARGMDELAERECREQDRERANKNKQFKQAVAEQVKKELKKHGLKEKQPQKHSGPTGS